MKELGFFPKRNVNGLDNGQKRKKKKKKSNSIQNTCYNTCNLDNMGTSFERLSSKLVFARKSVKCITADGMSNP